MDISEEEISDEHISEDDIFQEEVSEEDISKDDISKIFAIRSKKYIYLVCHFLVRQFDHKFY